jgi:ribosomal protein L13E
MPTPAKVLLQQSNECRMASHAEKLPRGRGWASFSVANIQNAGIDLLQWVE